MWWILLIGAKSGINDSATLGKSAVHKILSNFLMSPFTFIASARLNLGSIIICSISAFSSILTPKSFI